MPTVTGIFIALACIVAVWADGTDDPSASSDVPCLDRPCGAFICQARCIASCMDTGTAANLTECTEKFCTDLSDISPCNINDTACWKTCGFKPTLNEQSAPPPVPDIKLVSNPDGVATSDTDPYTITVNWPVIEGATLYVAEAFPMYDQSDSPDSDVLQRAMTDTTSITFTRDICGVYMIRIMAANAFGVSPPRYMVIDSWNPELHFDENFDIRSIRRDDTNVNVFIEYTPPKSWRQGDVKFQSSQVRAYDCLGPLDNHLFLNTQPDSDGYVTPFVVINENGTNIQLSFPAKIMHSKCLFSYRIASLKTRCNNSVELNTKGTSGAGVDFSINCLSVENSNCDSSEMTMGDDKNNTSSSEEAAVAGPDKSQSSEKMPPPPPSGQIGRNGKMGSSEEMSRVDGDEVGQQGPAVSNHKSSASKSSESAESSGDRPDEIIIVVEPSDPNTPVCRLADFDAVPIMKESKESEESGGLDLTLTWMEGTVPFANATLPSYFLIRYGPVIRTLVVNPQPEITNEAIRRAEAGTDSSDESIRMITIRGLIPYRLYGFQICAIYSNAPPDSRTLWDQAPVYTVDLCALMDGTVPNPNPTSMNVTDDDLFNLLVGLVNSTEDDPKQKSSVKEQPAMEYPSMNGEQSAVGEEDMGVLEIDVPVQPQEINVNVTPIIVENNRSLWASMQSFWSIVIIAMFCLTAFSVCLFAVKRSRRHRMKKLQQFNETVNYPTPQVKVPVP